MVLSERLRSSIRRGSGHATAVIKGSERPEQERYEHGTKEKNRQHRQLRSRPFWKGAARMCGGHIRAWGTTRRDGGILVRALEGLGGGPGKLVSARRQRWWRSGGSRSPSRPSVL